MESDRWHVNATLAGYPRFDFLVTAAGIADQEFTDVPSRFVVDLLVSGGKSVQVRARAHTPVVDPLSAVSHLHHGAAGAGAVACRRQRQVTATLPETATFVFVAPQVTVAVPPVK